MTTQQEIWKPIPGWDGYYEISNLGNVMRCYRIVFKPRRLKYKSQIIKPWKDRNGYLLVTLRRLDERRHMQVHRIVATVFIDNPDNKPQINHNDCNKTNNIYSNLQWVTQNENMKHASDNGLLAIGERNKSSKLNTDNVLKIKELIKCGTRVMDVHKEFSFVTPSAIRNIKNNITWKHLAA
jgi:hypothetical protein